MPFVICYSRDKKAIKVFSFKQLCLNGINKSCFPNVEHFFDPLENNEDYDCWTEFRMLTCIKLILI